MAVAAPGPRSLADYNLLSERGAEAVRRGLADAKWYASPVPKEKMRALLVRRDGPAIRDTIIWLALVVGTGAAGFALWGTWWSVLPFFLYGMMYAGSSDSRWHESGHGTAFKTDWMNNALYELASFMVCRESVLWRWSHTRHHSDTIIVGRDPEIGVMRPVSWVSVFLKVINVPYIFNYYRSVIRHALGRMTPQEQTFIPGAEFPRVYLRARIYLLIYAAVIAMAIATRSFLPFMFIGLPNIYGAWLQWLYGVQQHAGLAEDVLDHRLNTRTVYMNFINRFLYWNMGYHTEHHMFPMVPYYNLGKLHELIKDDTPPAFHGLIAAYREVFPALAKQRVDAGYWIRRDVPAASSAAEAKAGAEVIISQFPADAEGWVEVCELGTLMPGGVVQLEHSGRSYAVYRTFVGKLYASDARCTHGNALLSEGFLQGACIECPKHNGRFDIKDGSVLRPPPREPLKTYPARERGGRVYIRIEN
jgi:fatty acid desaturase/nitrite reductase/ring-hydroxylating ferredoxin subunit